MNWMVAFDNSEDAHLALKTAITRMNKKEDTLYVFYAVEHITNRFGLTNLFGKTGMIEETQRKLEDEANMRLFTIVQNARQAGVLKCFGIVSTTDHVGDAICQAAKDKLVDVLVVGRRGLGAVKRLMIGSTSKYCLENAPCSVLIAKKPVEFTLKHDEEAFLGKIKEPKEEHLPKKFYETSQGTPVGTAEITQGSSEKEEKPIPTVGASKLDTSGIVETYIHKI